MVEVHHQPERALSDGAQSLYPEQFAHLQRQVAAFYDVMQENGTKQEGG
jgi:3-deoxy-7-phosphoheptulonate synthase